MKSIAQDRLETAVRNILSGRNACDALKRAVDAGDAGYFLRAIAPVVAVYEAEAAVIREQRQAALADAETKRQALEYIASNALAAALAHISAFAEKALGR